MEKIKIGVIGTGRMGQFHVNVGKQVVGEDLIGFYDADAEKNKTISDKFEIKSYPSIDELLNDVDAVVIAAPTFLHYEISKKALLKGKHVLVEKPICETVEQAKEIAKLAKEKNLILQVGHVERFNGAILEVGKIVDSPYLIEARRQSPFSNRISDVGVVLDMMIHDIDIVLNLVKSKVIFMSAAGAKVFSNHEDIASVILKFENGCVASINTSRCTQSKVRTLNISQKDSYVQLDFIDQEIELHRQASSNTQLSGTEIRYKQESIVEKIFVHKDNPLKQEHEHFVNCINGKASPLVDNENDIATLEIAHKILKEIQK